MAEHGDLVGTWQRDDPVETSADPYPTRLIFDTDGMYRGEADQPDTFTLWDVGTFEVLDDDHIAISTANDAIIRYHFALIGDHLTFTDPTASTTWTYRRIAPPRSNAD